MFAKIELWCVVYCFVVAAAQELAGFHENHTIDFDRDQVLADIVPGTQHVKPSQGPVTDLKNDDDGDVVEEMPTDTSSNRIIRKSTTARQDEVAGRFAPVMSLEDAVTTNSTQTTTAMGTSARDMTTNQDSGVASPSSSLSSATEMPPHIRWPNSPLRVVVMEQNKKNYRVNCVADGHPDIVYEWLKDDQTLDDTGPFIKAFPNGSLVFTEFSEREDGVFQCRVTNQYGTSVSVKVPIIYEKPPKALPDDAKVNKSYEATEGQPINLTCADTPPTVPEYQRRWYLLQETTQLQMTDVIGTDAQGVLRFAYVETKDATSYICALAPEVAAARDSIRLYNSAILKVHPKQKLPTAPKLEYISRNVKAVVGGKAVLECFFSGYPTPKIIWRYDGQMLNETDTRYSFTFGRRLTIPNVSETDRGTYTCTATNGYGTRQDNVNLNVTGPPQKSANEGLDNIVKPEGGNVVLKCKARAIGGQRLEAPVWFRNGQPFNESSPAFSSRHVFRDGGRELHISNLNKEIDTACFQCNISNSEGYLFYDGFLKVINSFEITKRPESDIVLAGSNQTFDITVQVKGDTCCHVEYRWQLNGSIFLEDEFQKPPFERRDNGDLLFNPSSVSNETMLSRLGNYSCRIFDNYQEMVVSFVITMKTNKPEELTSVAAEGVQLWWIGLLCGILLILIAVIIIVVVVKSNFPRNSYPLEKAEIKHHLNPEQDLLDQSFQEI